MHINLFTLGEPWSGSSPENSVSRAGMDIGLLLGAHVILFALAYVSFLKQDLRQEIG